MSAAQHPRWRPGDRLLVRGDSWHVLERSTFPGCEALRLRSVAAPGSARTILLPFDRPQRLPHTPGIDVVRPRTWGGYVTNLVAASAPAGGLGAAAHSAITLLPYQLEPALLMRRDGVARVMIADGVGLGKTIQAGLLITQLAEEHADLRALAIVPAGLRDQWTRELRAHFGIESTLASSVWLARAGAALPGDVNPWSLPGIYVTSMDLVKRPEVLRPLEDLTWDLVIVDEAHGAAAGTARRAAIHAVARRARRMVLLTATPHSGDVEQFSALCRIGAADGEAPIVLFRRTPADVGRARPRRRFVLAVRLSTPEHRLHRLLEAYTRELCREAMARGDARARLVAIVLRKRALSSAASLAQSCTRRLALLAGSDTSVERQMLLPLDDEDPLNDREPDSLLGAPGLPDVARERRRLTQIASMATDAGRSESKVRCLVRLLRRVQEPAIVFTEYRDTLERLHAALAAERERIAVLHGGMRPADRAEAQRQFNTGARSLLLATDAASEGLNLQERCRLVVHFELPWSPARLEQRAGRVDRIGQRHRVHEIIIVADDTAERLVLVPLLARVSRTRSSLGGGAPIGDVLSESHVAAAVLGNGAVPEAGGLQPAPIDFVEAPAALHDEAVAEVMRLTRMRQCLHAPRRRVLESRVAATYRRQFGSLLAGAVALYSLNVASRDGRIAHGELTAIHCRLEMTPPPRSASALRGMAQRYISTYDRAVREYLQRQLSGHLDTVSRRIAQASRACARRERAILESVPSAASELVQAGLFDQRAQRAAADRLRASAILLDDSHRRLDDFTSSARTEPSWQLRGLMFIGMGPG